MCNSNRNAEKGTARSIAGRCQKRALLTNPNIPVLQMCAHNHSAP